MYLNSGVSKFNLLSFFLFLFVINLILFFGTTMITYLLEDRYGITENELGTVAGDLGFYSDLCVVASNLVLGALFDIIGRKGLSIIGFAAAGVSLILMPCFTQVYPPLLILRIVLALGVLPGLNTPLLLDYISQVSMGAACAWINIISTCAELVSTSGAIAL